MPLPASFHFLKSEDANIEMIINSKIQPVNLHYQHNLITDSIAFIFVNTECNGLPYRNAEERGEHARSLFKDVLEFKDV